MTMRDFCYWLMGMWEVRGVSALTKEEVQEIKNHLDMVFVHDIDPKAGNQIHQDHLNEIHSGNNSGKVTLRC